MNTGQFMNKLNKCHENSSFVVKKSQNAKYKQFEIPIDISVAIASFFSAAPNQWFLIVKNRILQESQKTKSALV